MTKTVEVEPSLTHGACFCIIPLASIILRAQWEKEFFGHSLNERLEINAMSLIMATHTALRSEA